MDPAERLYIESVLKIAKVNTEILLCLVIHRTVPAQPQLVLATPCPARKLLRGYHTLPRLRLVSFESNIAERRRATLRCHRQYPSRY